jgi:hypothetical protein
MIESSFTGEANHGLPQTAAPFVYTKSAGPIGGIISERKDTPYERLDQPGRNRAGSV